MLILDNSLSMGYREADGTRFDLARHVARQILEGLQTRVLVIPTAHPSGKPLEQSELAWVEPREALQKVGDLPLSFGRGDPVSALRLAHRQLKESRGVGEIIIVSDLSRGDWEGFTIDRLERVSAETNYLFVRIGSSSRDPNLALKDVRIKREETISGVVALLEVNVSNFSDHEGEALVELYASGSKRDQRSLSLKADEEGVAHFEFLLGQPGWLNVEVRLSEDRLPLDNAFYIPLQIREKIKVLVVDGAPRPSPRQSESYYLTNALNPGGPEGSPFRVEVVAEDQAGRLDLKGFDVLFLLNVSRLKNEILSPFLGGGKPVFIFLGDSVIPEEYHRFPHFPWSIGGFREAVAGKGERIDRIDQSSETLKLIASTGGQGFQEAAIHRYFRIGGGGRRLLTLSNGDPLLLESTVGKGKVFLFASSADLDWNDLPLKGAYLPLIQGLVKEAVSVGSQSPSVETWPGAAFQGGIPAIQMAGPRGGPGIYRLQGSSGEKRVGLNAPMEESDLRKLGDEEIEMKLKPFRARIIDSRQGLQMGLHGTRRELWPFLLLFVLGLVGLEMFLANRE